MAEVHSVSFRDKGKGWRNYSLRIGTSAGTLAETRKENAWLQGFLNDLFLRPSCTVCPFKAFDSRSDLTLSDFWTLGKYLKGRDDDKGASLLYVNTEKGRKILEESADLLDRTEVEKYKYPLVLFSPASYNPTVLWGDSMLPFLLASSDRSTTLTRASESTSAFAGG